MTSSRPPTAGLRPRWVKRWAFLKRASFITWLLLLQVAIRSDQWLLSEYGTAVKVRFLGQSQPPPLSMSPVSTKATALNNKSKKPTVTTATERDVIVVTGGVHNIGRHLVETIQKGNSLKLNSEMITLVVLYSRVVPSGADGAGMFSQTLNTTNPGVCVKLVRVDITDYDASIRALSPYSSRIRGVVHLAAVSRVQDCHAKTQRCEHVNVGGTSNIVRALWSFHRQSQAGVDNSHSQEITKDASAPPWIIFASSREVYGALRPNEEALESSPMNPLNIYGDTKVRAEKLLRWWTRKAGFNTAVLRFTNVYGSCHDHGSRLVPKMTSRLVSGDPFFISDSSEKTISMLHVKDAVQAILLAIGFAESQENHSVGSFEAFNIGGGPAHDVLNILEMFLIAQRTVSQIIPDCVNCNRAPVVQKATADRSPEPEHFRASVHKAQRVLGYKALHTFNEGTLGDYVRTCVLNNSTNAQ